MPDVETVLETCFIELSKEYDIEEVDSIPRFEKKIRTHIWKVQIPALVLDKAEDVEVYILFPKDLLNAMCDYTR